MLALPSPMPSQVYAVDVFQSAAKLPHIGRVAALPPDPDPLPAAAGLPSHMLISWMVPNYAPGGLLGSKKTNGPGWTLVIYCKPSESLKAIVRGEAGGKAPSIDLLRRYMHPGATGSMLRGNRLKCVFGLVDKEGLSFGMVMKKMISRYNFKPFLSKTASFCYQGSVRRRCEPITMESLVLRILPGCRHVVHVRQQS